MNSTSSERSPSVAELESIKWSASEDYLILANLACWEAFEMRIAHVNDTFDRSRTYRGAPFSSSTTSLERATTDRSTFKASVVIPTLCGKIDELETVRSLQLLEREIQIVVLVDRRPNVSRARNLAAGFARSDILLFIDDDVTLSSNQVQDWIELVRAGYVVWLDPPLILGITRKRFSEIGGFDERIPFMAETTEMLLAVESRGYPLHFVMPGSVGHLGKLSRRRIFHLHWNGVGVWTRYFRSPLALMRVIFGPRTKSQLRAIFFPFNVVLQIAAFYYWRMIFHLKSRTEGVLERAHIDRSID